MTIWAILVLSLVGSPHCAAMCGLVAGAAGRGPVAAAGYHGARLLGYLTLGAIAGTLGSGVERLGGAFAATGMAARIAGLLLVAVGITSLLTALGLRRVRPVGRLAWIGKIAGRVRDLPVAARAGALGALTAIFPCGWLAAFVVAAAGTGSPLTGAAAMGIFWLGTVPALIGASLLLRSLTGAARSRLPVVAAILLIAIGIITAVARPTIHAGALAHASHVRRAP